MRKALKFSTTFTNLKDRNTSNGLRSSPKIMFTEQKKSVRLLTIITLNPSKGHNYCFSISEQEHGFCFMCEDYFDPMPLTPSLTMYEIKVATDSLIKKLHESCFQTNLHDELCLVSSKPTMKS